MTPRKSPNAKSPTNPADEQLVQMATELKAGLKKRDCAEAAALAERIIEVLKRKTKGSTLTRGNISQEEHP